MESLQSDTVVLKQLPEQFNNMLNDTIKQELSQEQSHLIEEGSSQERPLLTRGKQSQLFENCLTAKFDFFWAYFKPPKFGLDSGQLLFK